MLIVCAGRDGASALDDAYAAGRLGGGRARQDESHTARSTMRGSRALDLVRRYGDAGSVRWAYSRGGRELIRVGFRDESSMPRGSTRTRCFHTSTNAG